MGTERWTSALSPHQPPVPRGHHWGAGLVISLAALATGIYLYARANLPDPVDEDEAPESVIVALGAPAQRLEEPPPPPEEPPPPEPPEPQVPTERAEDAPPPAPPPQPRPVFQQPTNARPSSGFGTGTKPAPPPPPPPPKELSRQFIDISTYAYVSQVEYPYNAMRRQQEGTGRLMVVIDRSGVVRSWNLIRSTGHNLLDREIERVAKRVEQLDPLPPDWDRPTAKLIIPFTFVLDR